LELNRRLAPDVHLGVGELTDPVGGLTTPTEGSYPTATATATDSVCYGPLTTN